MPYALALLAGTCFALLGFSYKLAHARGCRAMPFAAGFLATAMLLAGVRAAFETTTWADPRLWALGGFMGVMLFAALTLVVLANRLGPASVSWMLVNLSLLIPIVLSAVLLREAFYPTDVLLLLTFGLMLTALRHGVRAEQEGTASRAFWPLLGALYVTNGLFQYGCKLKDAWFGAANSGGLAVVYFGVGMALALVCHLARTRERRFRREELLTGAQAGLFAGLGNLLILGAMSLPAIVVYPLSQGISLTGGVGLTALLYHEKLTRGKVVGFALSLCVLLLAVLREPLARWLG
ncbi:MAG: hypothetical protein HZB16_01565 [Armatimonadetes bacterium]|nr:hypothetical protein [Armatimonadota bacterium]